MQLGEREKNSIIISLILNLVFVLIFVLLWAFHAFWRYEEIEWKKVELKKITESTTKIKKSWISFNDFNTLKRSAKYTKTEFLEWILSEMKPAFYNDNFINKGEWNFEKFLEDKKRFFYANEELLAFTDEQLEELDDDVEEKIRKEKSRKEKILTILPSYNPLLKTVDENLLTDFKFVNYVESIIRTFDLQSEAKIWITWITPYEKKDNNNPKNKKIASSDAKIFYIPATFKLAWNKENIINFLHYVGNVWNIEISDGGFDVLNDDFLKKRKKIILSWDYNKLFWNGSRYEEWYEDLPEVKNYNIYNNQIIEIESISMDNYPVEYYLDWERDKDSNLVEFLKTKQRYEKLEVTVELRFYIKGVPNYKMIEFIKNFFESYNETKKNISSKISELNKAEDIQNDWELILLKDQFNKSNDYLNSIDPDIKKFQAALNKANDIDWLYESVLEYNLILDNIIAVLGLDDDEIYDEVISEETTDTEK